MLAETWVDGEEGKRYRLGADGAMLTSQEIEVEGRKYTIEEDGNAVAQAPPKSEAELQAEAIAAIVAGTQAIGQEAQAMEEYFQWPYLSFEPDELVVCYPAGALPGQEPTSIWGVDYIGLEDVLYPWAVPQMREQ